MTEESQKQKKGPSAPKDRQTSPGWLDSYQGGGPIGGQWVSLPKTEPTRPIAIEQRGDLDLLSTDYLKSFLPEYKRLMGVPNARNDMYDRMDQYLNKKGMDPYQSAHILNFLTSNYDQFGDLRRYIPEPVVKRVSQEEIDRMEKEAEKRNKKAAGKFGEDYLKYGGDISIPNLEEGNWLEEYGDGGQATLDKFYKDLFGNINKRGDKGRTTFLDRALGSLETVFEDPGNALRFLFTKKKKITDYDANRYGVDYFSNSRRNKTKTWMPKYETDPGTIDVTVGQPYDPFGKQNKTKDFSYLTSEDLNKRSTPHWYTWFNPDLAGGVQGGWHRKKFDSYELANEYFQKEHKGKVLGPQVSFIPVREGDDPTEYKHGGELQEFRPGGFATTFTTTKLDWSNVRLPTKEELDAEYERTRKPTVRQQVLNQTTKTNKPTKTTSNTAQYNIANNVPEWTASTAAQSNFPKEGVKTMKNDKDWFDNHANWTNTGNQKWDDHVRKLVLTGRFGVDPESGALIKLSENEWTEVPESYKEAASREWGEKTTQERFNSNTAAGNQLRKEWVGNSMQEVFRNPITYAPAAIAAAPFVAGAIATSAPIIGAAASTPMFGIPGFTVGNALTAYGVTDFALNRATELPGQIQRGEYTDAAANIGWGALDVMGLHGANPSLFNNAVRGTRNALNITGNKTRSLFTGSKTANVLSEFDKARLQEIRTAYHNSERFLLPEEITFVNNNGGMGERMLYRRGNHAYSGLPQEPLQTATTPTTPTTPTPQFQLSQNAINAGLGDPQFVSRLRNMISQGNVSANMFAANAGIPRYELTTALHFDNLINSGRLTGNQLDNTRSIFNYPLNTSQPITLTDFSGGSFSSLDDLENSIIRWSDENRLSGSTLPSDFGLRFNEIPNRYGRSITNTEGIRTVYENLPSQTARNLFLDDIATNFRARLTNDEILNMRNSWTTEHVDDLIRRSNSRSGTIHGIDLSRTGSNTASNTADVVRNRSRMTKNEVLARAPEKDKEKIAKMTETEFQNTVLKPDGSLVSFIPNTNVPAIDVIPTSTVEYADLFNSRLDLLNDIIAKNNKSGVEYRVLGLDRYGQLKFTGPTGESAFDLTMNPGQWRGDVEDIANTDYFRTIPGLEMSNTSSSVFGDRVARRGTGTYESLNEYLKLFDLGRVKAGFNSQTEFSKGAWENFINKNKAVGFYARPSTVYGIMKKMGGQVNKWLDNIK